MSNVLLTAKSAIDRTQVIEVEADPSGSLIGISHEHSKVHQEKFFACGYLDTAVPSGNDIEYLIETGAQTAHMYIKLIAGGDALFSVYEDSTFTTGTLCPIVNHNRTSENLPLLVTSHTPAGTGDGDILWAEFIPGGSTGNAPGAVQGVGYEQVVLKADSKYLFRLQNLGAGAQALQIVVSFYESPA